MSRYILLEYFNDYDQHGGYFRGVFSTWLSAKKAAGFKLGRHNNEYSWYEVEHVSVDKYYDEYDL